MAALFDTKEFRAMYGWFLTVGMTSIRTKAYQCDAITYGQKQTLEALASQGPDIHNEKLLDMVRAADSRESFKHLAEAVKSLGEAYEPKYKQLMAILDLGKGSADGTGSGSSGAAVAELSEDRSVNPWKHKRFVGSTASLIRKMTWNGEVRQLCVSYGLIDYGAEDELSLLRLNFEHNDKLLRILKQGSPDSFAKFREVIRHMDSTDAFTEMLREWDSIGPSPDQSEYQKLRRKFLSE